MKLFQVKNEKWLYYTTDGELWKEETYKVYRVLGIMVWWKIQAMRLA